MDIKHQDTLETVTGYVLIAVTIVALIMAAGTALQSWHEYRNVSTAATVTVWATVPTTEPGMVTRSRATGWYADTAATKRFTGAYSCIPESCGYWTGDSLVVNMNAVGQDHQLGA